MDGGGGSASGLEELPGADGYAPPRPAPALLTMLERSPRASGTARAGELSDRGDAVGAGTLPRWIGRLLRAPLPTKLAGANAVLLVAAAGTSLSIHDRAWSAAPLVVVVGATLLLALTLNIALVALAVRPIHMLERTVDAIWHGDLSARVPMSLLADRHVLRVGRMFNILLDGLLADRARTRRLATELIQVSDKERAAMSRELHDSTAQSLAALVMQLSVAAQTADTAPGEALKERMTGAKLLAMEALEEVRLLAQSVHPRVLDDLGLVAALRRLAREASAHTPANRQGLSIDAPPGGAIISASVGSRVSEREGLKGHDSRQRNRGQEENQLVRVSAAEGSDATLPVDVASVLYRVAQEAVRNALRHAAPRHVDVRFWTTGAAAHLEVADDGRGFDPVVAAREHAGAHTGIGLFTMRERVALVDGTLDVTSATGRGTTIGASVPLLGVAPLSFGA